MKRLSGACALALASLTLAACGTTVNEVHYFASYDSNGKPTEFFRLTVTGSAQMSGAKFQSGYYDERALDLFFNQVGSDGRDPGKGKNMLQCPAAACDVSVQSLNPGQHGSYLMILSTDADAVTNAIGAFAGNEAMAQALSQIVNKDDIRERGRAVAAADRQDARGARTATAFEALRVQAAAAPSGAAAERFYLSGLSQLAHFLGGDVSFASMAEAETWFDAERAASSREGRQ